MWASRQMRGFRAGHRPPDHRARGPTLSLLGLLLSKLIKGGNQMIRKLTVSLAALAAMGIAGAPSAGDAQDVADTKEVSVTIEVEPFVIITMEEPAIDNIIDTFEEGVNLVGEPKPFTVTANVDHELFAEADAALTVPTDEFGDVEFGKAVDGSSNNEIGYFLNIEDPEDDGAFLAGFPVTGEQAGRPKTVTGQDASEPFIPGDPEITDYQIVATGRLTDTADGQPAEAGTYTGTATIVATVN